MQGGGRGERGRCQHNRGVHAKHLLEEYGGHVIVASSSVDVLGAHLQRGVVHILGQLLQRVIKPPLGGVQLAKVAMQLGLECMAELAHNMQRATHTSVSHPSGAGCLHR